MKKVLTLLFFITAVLITACAPKYKTVNGCEIRPKTQCSKFVLHEADLRKATYDPATRFPDGFDPKAAGMVLVE